MPASSAATEIKNVRASSLARLPAISVLGSSRECSSLSPRPSGARVEPAGPLGGRVGLQRFGRGAFQVRWNCDPDGDQQVTVTAGTLRHAASAYPQDASVRG